MQDDPKAVHETQQTAHGHSETSTGSVGQPAVEEKRSRKPKRGYFGKGKNWVSFLTLLFVGAYTILTVFILYNSQEQTRISEINFKMDQRPYVLVEDIKGQTLDFKKGENARWDIQFVNYGKSPSIKEVTDAHVWVGKNAVAMMDNYFRNLPEIVPPKSAEFIVPPNASGGPNGFHYVTVWSDAVINPDDVVFMKAEDGGVIMAGRTWYYDIFGESHRTDFCRHTLVSGAVSDCPRHNEIR